MPRTDAHRIATALATLALVTACTSATGNDEDQPTGEAPAHLELVEGSDVSRITLTQPAAERLGVSTEAVEAVDASGATAIPYAAVLYDVAGATWVYTSPEPLVFLRAPITITSIEGERVTLSVGPAPGTAVVTVGAAELFGEELDVGH